MSNRSATAKLVVRQAAVLGAGTMGARIAAHLANCGIPTLLLDLPPAPLAPEQADQGLDWHSPPVRNRLALAGLELALQSMPPAFFTPERAALVTVGNMDDHLERLRDADWIIEAVAENLAIKRALWQRVAPFHKPGAVVSTNTSGLSIREIADGLPEEFRQHWLGTHFFNPPRYLHLLEIIPGPDTLPEVIEQLSRFADVRLGKGIVVARDTPNFIANRIGVYCTALALRLVREEELTVEQADHLFCMALGWPRSALFGTLDLVGLDIFAAAARTVYDRAPHDECRDIFQPPELVAKLLERGWLGDKSDAGFYRRPKKGSGEQTQVLDLESLEYRPFQQPGEWVPEEIAAIADIGERLRALLNSDLRPAGFLRKFLGRIFAYSASRIPEITSRIVEIDRAMRWGYGWRRGPFELWDAIGVQEAVRRMEAEGVAIPATVAGMLQAGQRSFYDCSTGRLRHFDFSSGSYVPVSFPEGILLLAGGPATPPVVRRNAEASLRELDEGVLCVEFHGKRNVLGAAAFDMLEEGLTLLERDYDALVIGNQGEHFSAGANLRHLLALIESARWTELEGMVSRFQQITQALWHSPKPVVAAPFGQTLGGGCELVLAATRAQAAAETYMGLVEAAVGLVPAGGGLTRMLARLSEAHPNGEGLLAATGELFRTLSRARVSSCAEDARRLGFLRSADGITMNPDRLLADARQAALALARSGYHPPRAEIRVLGEGGLALLRVQLHLARRGEFLSEYDAVVAGKLAYALCGGPLSGTPLVGEDYLLGLERESFLSLCGETRTQQRIRHMLQTGKPLRN